MLVVVTPAQPATNVTVPSSPTPRRHPFPDTLRETTFRALSAPLKATGRIHASIVKSPAGRFIAASVAA